ncbi:hypothetical protein RMATCC62417_04793 [Rhizopus microsporus]|nr:hypothetical protein RMATCC62417_04793 [Rhizopus microsporus]
MVDVEEVYWGDKKKTIKKEVEDGSFEAEAVLEHMLQHWRDNDVVRHYVGREVCLEKFKSLMAEAEVEMEDDEKPEKVKKKVKKKKRKIPEELLSLLSGVKKKKNGDASMMQ